jgi:quercetin dioxygenase-like cupin family protein
MEPSTTEYATVFGSLDQFDKGGVEAIADDPRNYVFSNMFEVAANAVPWEKVAVAKNMEYVLEVIRAEGTSPWRATPHDEFALVVDGSVRVELVDPADPLVDAGASGSIAVDGEPAGTAMGHIVAGHGHMVMLPAGRCYRFVAEHPSVILLQTIEGPDTVYRWAEICQTS